MNPQWRRTTEDGTEIVRTCAWSPPGCHPVGCGLLLHIKDGKIFKVEGDPEHPLTRGRTCIRCLTLPEYLYHPDRIIHPMKRDPKDRGKDKWEQISWDEALELAAKNIKEIQAKYGLEGTCFFNGTGRQAAMHTNTQAYNVLQTPNCCYAFSGYSCYGPRVTITAYVVGAGVPEMDYAAGFADRFDDPRYELSKYILIWGKNPLVSNPDGQWGHGIIEMLRRGSKLIVVDPRMTWLATRAEYALRLRPGTDAALAMAMLNVIINEDLYDHDFVDRWCYGFEQLAERVQDYPPEKVEGITWVKADKIRAAARACAQKPVSTTWGLPIDENTNGVQTGQAVMAIQAITGNLDIPGGTVLGPLAGFGAAEDQGLLPVHTPPDVWEKKIGRKEFPAFETVSRVQPDFFLEALETDEPYPVRFAWIGSSNFLAPSCSVQPERWHKALLKMEYIMATDLFMNPTIMALADLFLPVAAFTEANGIVANHYAMNTNLLSAINKAVEVGETRSDLQIAFSLAKVLHPNEYTESIEYYENAVFSGMASMAGLDGFEGLQTVGTLQIPSEYRKYEKGMLRFDKQPGFSTPTGRIELYCTTYQRLGEDPLPYYDEPHMGPNNTEFDFILTTGSRKYSSFHSEHRQIPSLRAIDPYPILEMNPKAAARLGIEDGDWVEINNDYGKAQFKTRLTPTIHEKIVNAEHGWWFPEEQGEEPNLFGVWKSNVNMMCPSGDNSVMGFGAPLKCLMCDVTKIEREAN